MPPPAERLPRFTAAERWVHRSTAIVVGVLTVTAMVLYYGPFAVLVGRRALVEGVHVAAGFALPVPTLLGLLSPSFRHDLARLNRVRPSDWEWLRRRDRRTAGLEVGKFNGGQKLAAAFVAGAACVLFGTGIVMLGPLAVDVPVGWRQGATLVHDMTALVLLVLLAGHVWQAYRHPEALAAMRTGSIPVAYAVQEHPAWVREVSGGRPRGPAGATAPPAAAPPVPAPRELG